MGRGGSDERAASLAGVRVSAPGRNRDLQLTVSRLKNSTRFIEDLQRHLRQGHNQHRPQTAEQVWKCNYETLRVHLHTPAAQRRLIGAIREAEEFVMDHDHMPSMGSICEEARGLVREARNMFVAANWGFIHDQAQMRTGHWANSLQQQAKEDLVQAGLQGVLDALDTYDETQEAAPLTWCRYQMMARMTEELKRNNFLVRYKGKSVDDLARLQRAAKEIRAEGDKITLDRLSDRAELPVKTTADLWELVNDVTLSVDLESLDRVVNADPDSRSFEPGYPLAESVIANGHSPEDRIIGDAQAEAVAQAVSEIVSPFRRRAVEMYYGVGREPRPQKEMFAGVYVDQQGRCYSAEPSMHTAYRAAGRELSERRQKELNQAFKAGELSFRPESDVCAELCVAGISGNGHTPKAGDLITRETGIPPTSGTIQDALKQAELEIARHPAIGSLGLAQPKASGGVRRERARALA